jgi:HAE1 family hydrophobic/amphiphilic exporter-1
MRISSLAIDKPFVVFVLTVVVIVMGAMAYLSLPLESDPEVEIPWVGVVVPWPGAAPDEIENLVCKPMEEELASIDDIKGIYSTAREGRGSTFIEFVSGSDLDEAKSSVREKLPDIRNEIPEETEDPILIEINVNDVPIMLVTLRGEADYVALKDLADDIAKEILEVKGVSSADIFGGLTREVQVEADPRLMSKYGVSFSMLLGALEAGNVNLPAGTLRSGSSEILIRSIGEFESIEDVAETVIPTPGTRPVRVGDVARVAMGFEEPESYSRTNGEPSVTIVIRRRSGINTVKTAEAITERLEEIGKTLPSDVTLEIIQDQSEYIHEMVSQLGQNALFGGCLVVIVLLIALGLRNALMVGFAIPFSLLVAFGLLFATGNTLNGVTLFALMLVVGIVVDGGIVIVENTFHHLQRGKNRVEAAKIGVEEVGTAVLAAALTTMSAFVPMLLMSGITGAFIRVIPLTVIFALLGSVIVDHIVIPPLAAKFVRTRKQTLLGRDSRIRRRFERTLDWSLSHRAVVLGASGIAFVGSLMLIPVVGVILFPEVDIGQFEVNIRTPPGSKLEYTDEVVREVERLISEVPEVDTFNANSGAAGLSVYQIGGSSASGAQIGGISVELVDEDERDRSMDEILAELREKASSIPAARIEFAKLESGPPVGAAIVVEVRGDDLDVLYDIAERAEQIVRNTEGTVDVVGEHTQARPELRVFIDRNKAGQFGVSQREVAYTLAAAHGGLVATEYSYGDEDIDVRVRLPEEYRNLESTKGLVFTAFDGSQVPFTQAAEMSYDSGPSAITRIDQVRTVSIRSDVSGRKSGEVLNDIREEMAAIPLPPGYGIRYTGENEDRDEAFASLWRALIIGVALIITVMILQFSSLLQPFVIITAIPLSVVGVVAGLLITGNPFGFASFLGIVALAGIVVNDAIVLVTFINQMRKQGYDKFEAARVAAGRRLRPVLLTTVSTIAGLLPLSLGFAGSGEFWAPIGWSIIFGLAIATVLTLIIIPTLYTVIAPAGKPIRGRLRVAPEEEDFPQRAAV